MFTFLSAVCVLLSVTSLQAEIGTLTTVLISGTDNNNPIGRNKNFVDVIKEKLRKNNYDYETDEVPGERNQTPIETRRMLNESEQSQDVIGLTKTEVNSATLSLDTTVFRSAMKEDLRKRKHEHRAHITHKVKSSSTMSISEAERKVHVDRWKLLVEKSNRLRKYTSSPKIEASSPAKISKLSRINNVMRTVPEGTTQETTTKTPTTTTSTNTTVSRPRPRQAPNFAMLPLRSPMPGGRKPPNADQLDMAPARGAYIHDLRLKGRFCYRHVLWPEGPKYNSKGETIMPAFNASLYHKRRKFFETAKPMFVLPRCCNCCKKSVLGCQ